MASGAILDGKRELLARGLSWSGVLSMLARLPARDSLLVLTYHRIGNPEHDPFDPGVFSATGDQFNEQISYLKRNLSLVTLEEALEFVDGTIKEKTRRCRVLITFDDGYLDNYEIAFPILLSHDVQGVFFLCTSLIGSCFVPWWDHIAYVMKTARRRQFSVGYPARLDVDIDKYGMAASLRSMFALFKAAENIDSERFIRELREVAEGQDLPAASRRFLNWDEAREMLAGGMAIGSHTHSHPVLSQLKPEEQRKEFTQSQAILKERLGIEAKVLAYPFGHSTSFSEQTQHLAQQIGFRAAFSYFGEMANQRGTMERYNLKRVPVAGQRRFHFQAQTAFCRLTGRFWP
jgi:peptidoglycan/xylan/chitin deacetylase (PgdA/CDA1 family)